MVDGAMATHIFASISSSSASDCASLNAQPLPNAGHFLAASTAASLCGDETAGENGHPPAPLLNAGHPWERGCVPMDALVSATDASERGGATMLVDVRGGVCAGASASWVVARLESV